ncbi:MAG: cytochrome c-type biogenesis protein CcmH [Anaerolineales bacterium]|nr:cytochrome c-type biogenesis protein CcmH [Anaerolineales bacterium]
MNKNNYKLQITNYLLIFAFLFVFTTSVHAQDNIPTDDEVNEVAHQLYCPVCENRPLDTCPTEACHQWRELIRLQLSQGMTEEQIKQYFVDQYGDRVLAEPPRTGLNWLIYILPPVIILLGAFLLFKNFQAWTKPKATESVSNPERSVDLKSNEYIAKLEEELKKRN